MKKDILNCEICGKKTKKNHHSQKYCKKCAKKTHKQNKKETGVNDIYNRKRRARINCIIEDFSNKEWLEKLTLTKGICPECKKYVGVHKLSLDHIYPISLAYKIYLITNIKRIYTIDDVQPLCLICNIKKGNKRTNDKQIHTKKPMS